jgi:hypothetical protein
MKTVRIKEMKGATEACKEVVSMTVKRADILTANSNECWLREPMNAIEA